MQSNIFRKKIDGKKLKIAIVRSRFNEEVTQGLLDGCIEVLQQRGVREKNILVIEVPGAFEIPFVASLLAKKKKYHVIIALGAVVKGETKHDEYIANAVSQALMRLGVESGVPVIFGVLTPNTMEQAQARSAQNEYNKGRESALAALEMTQVKKYL